MTVGPNPSKELHEQSTAHLMKSTVGKREGNFESLLSKCLYFHRKKNLG